MFKFIDFILQFLYAKLCMHFGCTERGITILLYTAIFELWNMHVSSSRQKSRTPVLYKILENKAHAEVHLYTQIGYSCEIQKATKRERQINTPSKTKLYMFQLHGDCPCRGGTGTPLQPGPTPAYQASQQYKTDQNVVSCGWKIGYGICVVCQRWQSLYYEDNNHWVTEICCS